MRIQAPGHSRRRRTFAASLILPLAAGTLVACSGDGNAEPKKSSSASPDASTQTEGKRRDCQVSATLSGDVKLSLEGAGQAVYENETGPDAFYLFSARSISVQAYSKGKNFAPSVVVGTDNGSYTTQPGAKGLKIETDGSGAVVNTKLVGMGDDAHGLRVKATYTCK